jgi:hypothetical protein
VETNRDGTEPWWNRTGKAETEPESGGTEPLRNRTV